MNSILNFISSVIPYLPALIVLYAVIKLLSSGLNVVAKVISTLVLCAIAYYAFMYLTSVL